MSIVPGSSYEVIFRSGDYLVNRICTYSGLMYNKPSNALFFCFSTDNRQNDIFIKPVDLVEIKPIF